MKPEFEVSKNIIILCLISIIGMLVTHDIIRNKITRNKASKSSQNEINCDEVKQSYIEAINYLQDENEKLVWEKNESDNLNITLKKKVDFYFGYYRKNKLLGFGVIPDTTPFKRSIVLPHYKRLTSDCQLEIDTMWVTDSTYFLKSQLDILK